MKALLLDLDGVLYQGDQIIPGAREAVRWLQGSHIPHLFITNTTSRPRHAICEKLAAMEIEVPAEKILTPVIAARHWIKSLTLVPSALLVPNATITDFEDIPRHPDHLESGAASLVVGDLGERWDYALLNRAFRLLMNEPPPILIALGMTRYWRADDGLRLDVAPFVRALEHASGREAVVLGKPSAAFFQQALALLDRDADQTWMVGDDIVGDVQGAQSAGLKGVLVKTGKFRPSDLEGERKPDAVLDSISELPQWCSKY